MGEYGAKIPTVSNFWKKATFCCEECGAPLTEKVINTRIYFACDSHGLLLPWYMMESAVNSMTKEIVDEAEDGCLVNLKNRKWTARDKSANVSYRFRVMEHSKSGITVNVKKVEDV